MFYVVLCLEISLKKTLKCSAALIPNPTQNVGRSVSNPGPLDEDAIRRCFGDISRASSGCLLEVAQREVGTIFGDYERGRRYVQLAK